MHTLRNFKSFAWAEVDLFKPVTVLIGPNGVAHAAPRRNLRSGFVRPEQRTTRCRDKKAAEAVARDLERTFADPNYSHEAAEATLTSALTLLVRDRAEQAKAGPKSAATVDFYRVKCGHLVRVFERDENDQPVRFLLSRLHARHVDDYISRRRSEGASENTISKELVALRAALKLARRRGLWSGDLAALFPPGFAPEYKPRERFLSREELQLLFAQLEPDRAARVAFIIATSANWNETERARREHIAPDLTTVFIDGTKRTSRRRAVPIVSPEQSTLLTYALEHAQGSDGALFTPWGNVNRDLRSACKRAGIPRCSPNDLRRTCATWLHAAGATPDLIAPVMGHVDTRMVERVY